MKVSSTALVLVFLGVISLSCADESSGSSEVGELTSEEAETLVLFIGDFLKLAYSEDKLNTIAEAVEKFKQDFETENVTLVASQKIYDDVGNVKEIRTIELSIPNVQPSINTKKDVDEFNIDDIDKIREIKEMIQALTVLGTTLELVYLEQDKDEDIERGLYISKDLFALKTEGVIYGNKSSSIDTIEQVQAEYKQLIKTGTIPTSYLAYDKKGNFIKAESTVVPEEFAVVESDYGTPREEIIQTTLHSLVNVFLESKSKDDVPENLRQNLESHYPGVTFMVTIDESVGAYINKDFSIHLNYELGLEDTISYSVYGYNRTA